MTTEVIDWIDEKLCQDWSPEQISGPMKHRGSFSISHERIYQHIWPDTHLGETLDEHLRWNQKKRQKRYGSKDNRGQIKNRVMIDQRPKEVEAKSQIGDWEIDTVIGANHKGALVTIVEHYKDYEMAENFLPCDRNQSYLLPPSLIDWLPQDHLAWFVLDAVEQIDLTQFYKKYGIDGVGNSAFHPSMMVALLIYS